MPQGPEMVVLLLIVGVPVLGAIDALRLDSGKWAEARKSKALWVALQLLGALFIFGLLFTLIYLIGIRSSVVRASATPAPPADSPGPGWWKASDGNWYSPESAPGGTPPPPPPGR